MKKENSDNEVVNNNQKISVGELAKQGNVTIRTLQYYDKIGLLKPSSISEGGRRLYDANDLSVLHQIITLKSLGLSLKDIEKRLMPTKSNKDIISMLDQQKAIIKEQISKATKSIESIDMLQGEIRKSNKVDWSKYSNMVKLIGENNEYYWVVNFLDQEILESITKAHANHDEKNMSVYWFKTCLEKAIELDRRHLSPDSSEAQALADEWWQSVLLYTQGDQILMKQLYKFYAGAGQWPSEFGVMQKQSQEFLEKAIEIYLKKNNLYMPEN